jgi:hypothetical protein
MGSTIAACSLARQAVRYRQQQILAQNHIFREALRISVREADPLHAIRVENQGKRTDRRTGFQFSFCLSTKIDNLRTKFVAENEILGRVKPAGQDGGAAP